MKIIFYLFFLLISSSLVLANTKDLVTDKNYIVKRFEWNSTPEVKKYYQSYFSRFTNKPFDNLSFKLKVDQINKELLAGGYFDSVLTTELVTGSGSDLVIKLNFKIGLRNNFNFHGNKLFSFQELKSKITEKIKGDFGKVDLEQIKSLIEEIYEEIGYYGTIVKIETISGLNFDKSIIKNFIINIDEGRKISISRIVFRGNNFFTSSDLEKLYFENASSLSSENFYDKKYTEKFTSSLKRKYLSVGFVGVEVSRPKIGNLEDGLTELEYVINEKSQVLINSIKFEGLETELATELKLILENKEGSPINIPIIEQDLKSVISFLQSKGYYFSSILNSNSDDLIKYDFINSLVDIKILINSDRKVCYNETIINGNYQTKNEVIFREIHMVPGDIIVPEKIESIRQKLSGIGLFSNLRITPYMIYDEGSGNACAKTNLIIQVKEREFGLVEFTPGFRTDLGLKTAVGITYNNLSGLNRSYSLKLQGNKRFNLDSLDKARQLKDKELFEYSAKFSYLDPYLFYNLSQTQIEFETSFSAQRKRFSAFDADIYKISPQLSKYFNKHYSVSLKYQLEKISQFEATSSKDNDNYTIGGITPSLTIDYRDDQINPKKGGFLNISAEWANHYLGSMKENDFEVNYLKLITRTKFYYPVGDFVFATSLAGGFEKNYAKGFFIPNIKVFRLDGFDEIRGFEDIEINRLTTGVSVNDVTVNNSAYFLAFKFEPRYSINDSMQFALFYDAGRVFVESFKPLDLRSSVGFGIKFLTPVGSLDLDYGVKLKRESYPDGTRDATSRVHLSIGFF